MTATQPDFPIGSVGYNLNLLRGTWHDRVETFGLDGQPMSDDSAAGTPGPSPFDNLVYFDFDGQRLTLTNIPFSARKPVAKTFGAELRDDVLYFDPLGPGAYQNIGVSGGPGILNLVPATLGDATNAYMEPDVIVVTSPGTRIRHTVLYRGGHVVRTLTARGTRLTDGCLSRHALDPRGNDGPVHGELVQATVWQHLLDE